MVRQSFILLAIIFIGCQKISNNINEIELQCGDPGNLDSFRFIKLVSDTTGPITGPEGLQVQNEVGRDYGQLVTPKGCLKVPVNFQEKLVVARPSANEGYILYPNRVSAGFVHTHNMKSHRYSALTSNCKNEIATSSDLMAWPIDWGSVESSSYDWELVIQKENSVGIILKRNAVESLNRDWIDLTSLEDGVYQMQVLGRQLFSMDKVQTRFDCRLIIDQESPSVSLDRELVRIEGEEEAVIQASPGEPVQVQTTQGIARDSIFACLRIETESAESCQFNQLSTGYVTAPQRGNWILRLYAIDEAGNRGPFTERKLQVYDSNLVTTIRSLINQSELAQKAGNFVQSLILSVKAYEKMQGLGSKAEIKSVAPQVRKSVLESVALPHESLIFKNLVVNASSGIGFIWDRGQNLFLRANSHKIEAHSLTGEMLYTVDFKRLIAKSGNTAAFRLCESTGEFVASGDTSIYVFKGEARKAVWEVSSAFKVELVSVSQDCQHALVDVTSESYQRRRIIMDLGSGKTFALPVTIMDVVGLVNVFDRSQLIVQPMSGVPQLLELETGFMKDLRLILNISEIQSIKKAKDGSTGILDRDQRFSLFNRKGELVKQLDSVSFMQASQVPDEYVVIATITGSSTAQYLASDGSTRGQAPVQRGMNWSYLTANKNFLVGLSAGSNLVKIWSRVGNVYDEIYYKGDSIYSITFSESGDLAILSAQANRVIQLQNELIRRKAPRYWNALGLQFSGDGKELFFKEQQALFSGIEHYTESNLIRWDPAQDIASSHPISGAPLAYKMYPAYGSQMHDLQYFQQNGESFIASTIERDVVGIFRATDLSRPIEEYDLSPEPYISGDWLLDIAVNPSRDLVAAASQNGLVYLIDRKNQKQWDMSLAKLFPQYFQEYPVTLQFDKSGRFLFVTDVNRNLMKFKVLFEETTKEYRLDLDAVISEAGTKLAINGSSDRIAVVGLNALLKVFDGNLKELHSYDLSPGKFAVGQSVTFSANDERIYAGLYDGTWNELDLKTNQVFKVRFSSETVGATNLVVSPKGDQLAFMGGGFIQIVELDAEKVYKKLCSWLGLRLPYIPDLADEDRKLCTAP